MKRTSKNTRLFLEGQEVDLLDDISITVNYEIASVKDISKKASSHSKTIKLPGTQNNNKLFNFFFNPKSTGIYYVNQLPGDQTVAIYNNIPGLAVLSVNLGGNTFNTTNGSTLVTPITNGNVQYSYHNEIDFTNWSVEVSGNTSGWVICKVNGSIVQVNKVTSAVNTYLFPSDQYLYDDVIEFVFQTEEQQFAGNSGYNLDFKRKMKAVVLQDDQVILSGYAKIVSSTDMNELIEYEIQIVSELGNLNALLSNRRLQDLYTTIDPSGNTIDLDSPYDHQFTISNLTSSWSGGTVIRIQLQTFQYGTCRILDRASMQRITSMIYFLRSGIPIQVHF